jgi:hypothetical protein
LACNDETYALGMCLNHYRRLTRNGSPTASSRKNSYEGDLKTALYKALDYLGDVDEAKGFLEEIGYYDKETIR